MLYAIALEFVTIGCTKNFVAGDFRRDNLADDILVGKANDKTIFGGIIFVLRLGNEAFTSVVVGFSLTTTLVFGLISAMLISDV